MAIRSAKRGGIVSEIYNQMKELIISGEWGLGERIPSENELSRQFEVSRNTIRSAIQHMRALGMLGARHGQGTYVVSSISENRAETMIPTISLSQSDILDILDFRKTMEMGNVALATERADKDDLKKLRKAFETMVENQHDYLMLALADFQFHLNIAKASKNKFYTLLMIRLEEILYRHFVDMNSEMGSGNSIEIHGKILAAI